MAVPQLPSANSIDPSGQSKTSPLLNPILAVSISDKRYAVGAWIAPLPRISVMSRRRVIVPTIRADRSRTLS